jgi:LDH2 family malate/lactate/ureidoglycolate dehydrogenase
MPIVPADRLTHIGAALLRAAGASDEEANAVAVGCVNANLAGHDSHGVIAVPTYIVEYIRSSSARLPASKSRTQPGKSVDLGKVARAGRRVQTRHRTRSGMIFNSAGTGRTA